MGHEKPATTGALAEASAENFRSAALLESSSLTLEPNASWRGSFPNFDFANSVALKKRAASPRVREAFVAPRLRELGLTESAGRLAPLANPDFSPLGHMVGRLEMNHGLSVRFDHGGKNPGGSLSLQQDGNTPYLLLHEYGLSTPEKLLPLLKRLEIDLQTRAEINAKGFRLRLPIDEPLELRGISFRVRPEDLPANGSPDDPARWMATRMRRHGIEVVVGEAGFTGETAGAWAYSQRGTVFLKPATLLERFRDGHLIAHEFQHAQAFLKCQKYLDCGDSIVFYKDARGQPLIEVPAYGATFLTNERQAHWLTLQTAEEERVKKMARERIRPFAESERKHLQALLTYLKDKPAALNKPFPKFAVRKDGLSYEVSMELARTFRDEAAARAFWIATVEKRLRNVENRLRLLEARPLN